MSYDNEPSAQDDDLKPSWPNSAADYTVILLDNPAPNVRRITLNRPDKRNALNHALRAEVLHALRAGDNDEDVHVQIVGGAGKCFSAGLDLQEVLSLSKSELVDFMKLFDRAYGAV